MAKPIYAAIVIFLCATAGAFAQSTGTVSGVKAGDSAIRQQLKQEMSEHRAAQQKAEAEFAKTLAGKTEAEKLAATKAHAAQVLADEKAFRAKIHAEKTAYSKKAHEERMALMKAKLASNTAMSAAEKAEMTSYMEAQYKKNAEFEDAQFAASQDFMEKLNNSNLTAEQRSALMKEQAEKTREAVKAQRAGRVAESKVNRDAMRAKRQAELKAAAAKKTATK